MNDKDMVRQASTPTEASGFSVGSFFTAIASLLVLFSQPTLGLVLAVLAITLAAFGLRHPNGRWMAGVGLSLGLVHVVLWVFFVGGLMLTMINWETLG